MKKGDLGGYVWSERALSQYDDCWIQKDSKVMGNSMVCLDAVIGNKSVISGYVVISGNSVVRKSVISGDVLITGDAFVYGCDVSGHIKIYEHAIVEEYAKISGNIHICGYTLIHGTKKHSIVINNDEYFETFMLRDGKNTPTHITWTRSNDMYSNVLLTCVNKNKMLNFVKYNNGEEKMKYIKRWMDSMCVK